MMSAAREPDQADFDLERFIDMFDEALTSKDERVIHALRSLMMMTILTRSETYGTPATDRQLGPLRRMQEDLNHLNQRLHRMEEEFSSLKHRMFADKMATQTYGAIDGGTKWEQVAAKQMASQIDEDMKRNIIRKINAGYTLGPEQSIKGLKDA